MAPGRYCPGAPTDPDLHNSRIRLVRPRSSQGDPSGHPPAGSESPGLRERATPSMPSPSSLSVEGLVRQIVRSGPRPSFAPTVPRSGEPFPPLGPCGMVPQLQRYSGSLRLLAGHLASLRFLRSAIPRMRSSVLARRSASALAFAGGVTRSVARGMGAWRRQGLPRFLESPLDARPVLRPRWVRAPGVPARRMLPSAFCTASAPTSRSSRGSFTRLASSLSTLRRQGRPCTTQDSLPAGCQPSPGGVRPAGLQ